MTQNEELKSLQDQRNQYNLAVYEISKLIDLPAARFVALSALYQWGASLRARMQELQHSKFEASK